MPKAKEPVQPPEEEEEEEFEDDDGEDDDSDEFEDDEEIDLDEMLAMIDTLDERVQSLDRGFAAFMRAITVILGDIEIVLSPASSSEGKAAAQMRVRAIVNSLQASVKAVPKGTQTSGAREAG